MTLIFLHAFHLKFTWTFGQLLALCVRKNISNVERCTVSLYQLMLLDNSCVSCVVCRLDCCWLPHWPIPQSTNLEAGCEDLLLVQHMHTGWSGHLHNNFHWSLSARESDRCYDTPDVIYCCFNCFKCSFAGTMELQLLGTVFEWGLKKCLVLEPNYLVSMLPVNCYTPSIINTRIVIVKIYSCKGLYLFYWGDKYRALAVPWKSFNLSRFSRLWKSLKTDDVLRSPWIFVLKVFESAWIWFSKTVFC